MEGNFGEGEEEERGETEAGKKGVLAGKGVN